MTHNGLAAMKQAVLNVDLTKTDSGSDRNIGHTEQDASLIGGAALLGLGLIKLKSPIGWAALAVGGGLLYRGLTGHCELYKKLGVDTSK